MLPASDAFANAPALSSENSVRGSLIVDESNLESGHASDPPDRAAAGASPTDCPDGLRLFVEEMLLDNERTVKHEGAAGPDVEKESSLQRFSSPWRHAGLQNGMVVRREFERQRLTPPAVLERGPIVKRHRPCLVIQLEHELFDELPADNPIDISTQAAR